MRCFLTAFTFLTVVTFLHADEKTKSPFSEARQRWLKGNYAEARELYEEKAKDEKLRAGAAVGIARTFISEGAYAKALETIDAALQHDGADAGLHAARAELLYQTGKWDDALKAVEAALKAKKDLFQARWVRAQIYRDRGDYDSKPDKPNADTEMRWFVRTYSQRSQNDDDIKDPDELLIVGQAGAENARRHSISKQFSFILNEVYKDVVKFEPDCWMAEYLAGAMLLEKFNRPEAVKAFEKALKMNPRAAEALVGKAQSSLLAFEIKEAEEFAEQALKINPNLTMALRLRADVHLMTGEFELALKALLKATSVNDHEEPTLARLAGCYFLLKDKAAFDRVVAEVAKFNPKPAIFCNDLGSCLEERKYYTEAEKYFKLAVEHNEKLASATSNLALLYLRLAKEDEARTLLEKSFKADPFNIRVANSRKVLDHLKGYETKESPHYILRFDPKNDRILAEFVLDYLEENHAHLVKDFNFEPTGKVLVEIFNSHEMFSGRTVALPDLHTIGACSGRVVTMCSPRGKGLNQMFNWGRVIRHELVHIFNLAQTDFQVPHWLTEGLAVRNEGSGKPPTWNVILRERFLKDDLLTLDTIQLGFVRPRSQSEWALAYYQSLLYVEYLIETHGIESVGKLLDAYREGLDNSAALMKACKVDKAAFEKGYRAKVEALVKSIPAAPRPAEKAMTLAELEAAHEKEPDNVEVAAQLADSYSRRKRPAEAKKLAEQVLEKEKGHGLASIVKARLLTAGGDEDEARKLIEAAVEINGKDVRLRAFLARLCLESKEFAAAAEQFEQCRKLAPLDGDWLDQLQSIYTKLEETDKLAGVLREINLGNPDDLKSRLQLAKLLIDAKKYAAAEEVARDAMHIDVLSEEARKMLVQALTEQKKTAEAEKIEKRFETEGSK